jgi:hypothetical protein
MVSSDLLSFQSNWSNPKEESPSWNADIPSANQETSHILWNPEFYNRWQESAIDLAHEGE